jgi:hypothetical protein
MATEALRVQARRVADISSSKRLPAGLVLASLSHAKSPSASRVINCPRTQRQLALPLDARRQRERPGEGKEGPHFRGFPLSSPLPAR